MVSRDACAVEVFTPRCCRVLPVTRSAMTWASLLVGTFDLNSIVGSLRRPDTTTVTVSLLQRSEWRAIRSTLASMSGSPSKTMLPERTSNRFPKT